ncbi:MAG: copper homeostasis protein CutC [Vicinamibacterales bacterium]
MSARVRVESCVESLEAAYASAAGGADRVELCARLDVGGLTPSAALVERCVAATGLPVMAMARPRPGSFVYDRHEVDRMVHDVLAMRRAGAHGIVAGALTAAGDVDTEGMRLVLAAARPLPVTFHRAFDGARRLDEALDQLMALGVDRVLTSGGAATASEGAVVLRRLVTRAGARLVVMAGGGVRPHNVGALVRASGVTEVHARIIREPAPAGANGEAAWRAAVADLVAALPV